MDIYVLHIGQLMIWTKCFLNVLLFISDINLTVNIKLIYLAIDCKIPESVVDAAYRQRKDFFYTCLHVIRIVYYLYRI